MNCQIPRLFILTDRSLKQDLQRGMVIVRDYDYSEREAYAREIIKRCGKDRVMVAGDVALARRVGAAGLHVPQWQLPRLPRRLFCPKGWFITAACHDLKALKQADRHPLIRAAFLSPLFATDSLTAPAPAVASAMSLSPAGTEGDGLLITGFRKKPLGLCRFGLLARQVRLPLIALGGLKYSEIRRITGWGIRGMALRSGAQEAPNSPVAFLQHGGRKADGF